MATEHEVKIIATLDTSKVNSQQPSTQHDVTQSGGGMSQGQKLQTTAQTTATLAATSSIISAGKSIKNTSEMIKSAFEAVTLRMKELNLRVQAISYMYRKTHMTIDQTDRRFKKLTNRIEDIEGRATTSVNNFKNALESATQAAINNSRANNILPGGGAGGGGAGGLAALGKNPLMRTIFRGGLWSLPIKAFSEAREGLDTTDPDENSFASAVFKKMPRMLGDIGTFGITYFKRRAEEAKKQLDETAEALKKSREFFARLNEEIESARLEKYIRENKEMINVLTDSRLDDYVDEHAEKLKKLKDRYNEINDRIATRQVGLDLDNLKKQMEKLDREIRVEQELFDLSYKKQQDAAEAAKKLAEEMDNLNKSFRNMMQGYEDTLWTQKRAEARKSFGSMSVSDLIGYKTGTNTEYNRAIDRIKEIDEEINSLREFYNIQTTNEGRKSILDEIQEQIRERQRITSQKGTLEGDISAINNLLKAFREAAEALKRKAKELVDSEEFRQWKEALKGKSRQELDQMKKDLEEERDARREEAINAYTKGSEATTKSDQDRWRKIGEAAEKAMKDAETRIKEIETATKDGIKLEDPTDQMTSMGKLGMYMSMNNMTLQDPKLEKLNHISLTLVQIERNTQTRTVSRFL